MGTIIRQYLDEWVISSYKHSPKSILEMNATLKIDGCRIDYFIHAKVVISVTMRGDYFWAKCSCYDNRLFSVQVQYGIVSFTIMHTEWYV